MSEAPQRKEDQKWAIEKPKLDARRLRGIYFIDPAGAARRKLEVPMPAKIKGRKYKETCRADSRKTKYACIVEADESTRKRLEGTPHKDHEDHIGGKGINSLNRYNLVHKFVPMPDTRCESSCGERMGRTRENTGMAADQSQKQKRGDR